MSLVMPSRARRAKWTSLTAVLACMSLAACCGCVLTGSAVANAAVSSGSPALTQQGASSAGRRFARIGGGQGGQHGASGRDEPDRLAFAVAATVLAFRRDFKEAAGVFAVGIVSVLLGDAGGGEPAARHGQLAVRSSQLIEIRSYRRVLRSRATHLPRRSAAAEPRRCAGAGIVYFLAASWPHC